VIAAAVRVVDEISAPLVTAASVIPIVALAPVLYTMFGASVQTARQLIAALAVFIPVYINTLRGLRSSRPIHRDLMRAYAASPWQVTRTVTLPGALPFFFTGVRIASSLAVISALIAEYFGGPIGGLGKSITSAAASSNYPLAWAFVLGAILTGLVFYCVTLGLETVATWHRRPA
jgi:NitT/TauT family transport system permease protein